MMMPPQAQPGMTQPGMQIMTAQCPPNGGPG